MACQTLGDQEIALQWEYGAVPCTQPSTQHHHFLHLFTLKTSESSIVKPMGTWAHHVETMVTPVETGPLS